MYTPRPRRWPFGATARCAAQQAFEHFAAVARKAYAEALHPRVPAGQPEGGQWTDKGGLDVEHEKHRKERLLTQEERSARADVFQELRNAMQRAARAGGVHRAGRDALSKVYDEAQAEKDPRKKRFWLDEHDARRWRLAEYMQETFEALLRDGPDAAARVRPPAFLPKGLELDAATYRRLKGLMESAKPPISWREAMADAELRLAELADPTIDEGRRGETRILRPTPSPRRLTKLADMVVGLPERRSREDRIHLAELTDTILRQEPSEWTKAKSHQLLGRRELQAIRRHLADVAAKEGADAAAREQARVRQYIARRFAEGR